MSRDLAFIVSDLHLGSPHFYCREFIAFLDQLPAGATLVLNGDIIDDVRRRLPSTPRSVVDRLVRESQQRPVVWVRGNHDEYLALPEPGAIQFVDRWQFGTRLLVVHGADLDRLMPRHGLFKWLFRRLHRLRVALGFQDMHVAEYAKRWTSLYRALNEHVARNALRAAAEGGFAAIACGHTHAAMDLTTDQGRYLNTGAWTEIPLHYLRVDTTAITLLRYAPAAAATPCTAEAP